MPNSLRTTLEPLAFRALMGLPLPLVRRLAGRPVIVDGQVLDPELQWLLRLQQVNGGSALEPMPVEEGRELLRRQSQMVGGRQPVGEVREMRVPGGDGPVAARLYVPRGSARGGADPLLVFFHGGGMLQGDLDSHDAVCRFLAERAATRVLSVDYRLAPEHRYPAGVEDAWAAFVWAAEHAEELGADPERVAVGGDSAGGYLSAVVALRAAGAGVPLAFQLLAYPVTDMAETSASRDRFGHGFLLEREFIDLVDRSYLAPDTDRRDPEVSVLYAEKIPDGLAPALVVTAGFDPLRDEGEAYARRLAEAGVPVELKRYPGFVHGFLNMLRVRSAGAAAAEIAVRLKAALHP